jgi:hypothetical protein
MDAGYLVVYRMTQTEFNAGAGLSLTGGFIEIVGTDGIPTGPMYTTGVAGAAPQAIGSYTVRSAGEAIDAFNVVYDVDGVVCRIASSSSPSTAEQILGLALNAAAPGQLAQIIRDGVYSGYTGFSGGTLFLGLNGVVTHTPATTGVHVQVGNAINTMVSDIDVKTPIYL